jgi:hypothetical protein
MIRSVTFVVAVVVALVAAGTQVPRPAPVAEACSWVWPTLEERLDAASFVGVAQVVETGGPENAAPTLTPTATATTEPDETPLPEGTPAPPPPDYTGPELTGFSATIETVESLVGLAGRLTRIDDETRRDLEREIRSFEALGMHPPCPITLLRFRYAEGRDYLVIAEDAEATGLNTLLRWQIDGDEVVLVDPDEHVDDLSPLVVTREAYDRHFAGAEALFYEGVPQEGYVLILEERAPLASVLAAIEDALGLSTAVVTPPDTGNAGLAAGR